ncbi:hypothetical protein Mapa_016195 [Marchantia paleacea]|nr:hypothetical protein Mapa_016195 [Marchantia paleacea]
MCVMLLCEPRDAIHSLCMPFPGACSGSRFRSRHRSTFTRSLLESPLVVELSCAEVGAPTRSSRRKRNSIHIPQTPDTQSPKYLF